MHSEIIEPKTNEAGSKFLTSLGLIITLIVIVGISNFIHNRYGIPYIGYLTFVLYILIGVYVYRKKIRKYRYLLSSNLLIFETLAGKRNREIIRLNLNNILYFCPLGKEGLDKDTEYKSHYPLFDKKSPRAYVIAFQKDKKVHRIIFEPSQNLINLIEENSSD